MGDFLKSRFSNVSPITDITKVFSRTVTPVAMVIDCVRMAAFTFHSLASLALRQLAIFFLS